MKVKDLRNNGKVDSIELKIVKKDATREVTTKFGSVMKVCDAIGEDETGQVKITLWNNEIEKVKLNDKIKIKNGFTKEWQGELQLSAGKYGTLEIIG